ncbi:MAG: hypothetical protein A3E98_02080 [Candidatus Doudnabacteria bacterium RIFCSPHIGHO2_12_FULL_48_11]|uniref:Uncharacterized protein n=1 Tax=Candidatus Doudnabacteria bacterium RIFCSPHIGHO2_01_FULL_46_24 TaxID=1817825 RepID=A0A1F5NU93_9BACT|nr:MAG: hypothetical protein A2720_01620 [Candidatus Doudnabacteria bacterium RIFCSPHIGHO2_01_FULL_46_24]OGE95688.1 MAG: hypothetical protein A3E98_02080 [Candidatus Doudnabacteria bacterium RIFCSPHIGHO2_12_FULL_48_11]
MFERISPIVLAGLFLLAVLGSGRDLPLLAGLVVVVAFIATVVNYRRFGLYWSHLLLPVLYLLGVGGVYATVSDIAVKSIFLGGSVIGFYFLERQLGKESHLLQNLYLVSAFLIYLAIFAMRFYFASLSIWWSLMFIAFATWLLIVQGFAGITSSSKKYFILATVLAITELALGLILWPTLYFVNAAVVFLVFYLFWLLAFSAFFGKLTPKKIYWQISLVGLALIIVISTAAWQPFIK